MNHKGSKNKAKMRLTLILDLEITVMQKLTLSAFFLCILLSLRNQNAHTKKSFVPINSTPTSSSFSPPPSRSSPVLSASRAALLSMEEENLDQSSWSEYDIYWESCPKAEETIRAIVYYLYKARFDVAPALLRLAFHDCFVEECDVSILLDAAGGIDSEKDSPPNESLKGFDVTDIIKEELEEICPGVVSCADKLVLAAREGVVLAVFRSILCLLVGETVRLLSQMLQPWSFLHPRRSVRNPWAFGSRGFTLRETVSLLGSHSIGVMHCKFCQNRLYNFGRTNKPDPFVDSDFFNLLRSWCRNTSSASSEPSPSFVGSPSTSTSAAASPHLDGSPSSMQAQSSHVDGSPSSQQAQPNVSGSSMLSSAALSPHLGGSPLSSAESLFSLRESSSSSSEGSAIDVAQDGATAGFCAAYYRNLLQGKGILYSDQQLTAGEETRIWVTAYASDVSLFHKDFALAMMKLSNLRVLTVPVGRIRLNCSKVA